MRRLLTVTVVVSLVLVCGATSFWYRDAEPATNRTPESVADAVGGMSLELRLISEAWSDAITFTTYPRGLSVVFR